MQKTIAIIIPVHNSLEYTKKCLAGLEKLTSEAVSIRAVAVVWRFEVVVVDDGSDDGTADWIRVHHPAVHLCFGDGSLWWSGGINQGMNYALNELVADYILWWNNDIYPAEDYFKQLVAVLANADNATVYGSKVYKADGSGILAEQLHNAGFQSKGYTAEQTDVVWAFGGFFHRRWGHSFLYGMDSPDGEKFSKPLEADWLPGMGSVFPARVVLEVGEVNASDFPQYHADVDYTCRVRKAGYRIVVEPRLRIWNDTRHSGRSHENKFSRLIPALQHIKSPDHFSKEWLLYRRHAKTPLAFLVVIKKYMGYFLNFLKNKLFF
jgi:GT2 family glycosyltransferase